MVEYLPSKQAVASSSLVSRFTHNRITFRQINMG